MAKKPDDPRPHPGDKPAPESKTETGSDSAIDLSKLGEGEVSGISVVEWAALVEEPKAAGSKLSIDAPSDLDMLSRLADEDEGHPEGKPVAEKDIAELIAEAGAEFRLEDETPKPIDAAAADEDALFADMMAEGIDRPAPSGKVIHEAIFEAEADPASFVELGAAALIEEDVADYDSHAIVDIVAPESGPIDLGDDAIVASESGVIDLGMDAYLDAESAPAPKAGESGAIDFDMETLSPEAAKSGDPLSDRLGQDILFEQPISPTPAKPHSSRDLIAEELESGTDLLDARKARAKKMAEDALDDFLNETVRTDESSAVDLGSVADVSLFDEAQRSTKSHGAKPADSDIRMEDIAAARGSGDYADIDIEKMEAAAPKKGKKPAAVETDELEAFAGEEMAVASLDEEPVAKKGKKAEAVDEEDEEEAPEKKAAPAKAKGRAGAWFGGTFLGTLVGAGAVGGLLFSGVVPSEYLGYVGVQPVGEKQVGDAGKPPTTATPVASERTVKQIRTGDLDAVKPEDLAKIDENKPEELVARAEFHWLSHLRAERGKNPAAVLKADAEPVKQALADIEKAVKGDNADAKADALFLRGQIQEMTGNVAGARGTYAEGAKEFPTQKARFDSALALLDLTATAMAMPPGLPREALVALIVMFQAPPAGDPDEAGFRFWQALKLAREGKSAEAIKALADARAAHDQRRFLFPRKPQNPKSDPREEIFLKACDELRAAWTYQAKLKNPDYLAADEKDRLPEVDKLLAASGEAAKAEQLKGLAKLYEGKKVEKADDLAGLVAEERKAAEKEQLAQKTKLDDTQKKVEKLEVEAKTALEKIAATEKTLKETQAVAKQAQADADADAALLSEVGKEVGTKFTDLKTSRDPLLKEVREAVRMSKVVDPAGTMRKLERDLTANRAKLAQRWEPSDMLSFWVPILQKDRGRKDLSNRAMVDVQRIFNDPASKDEAKAQALLVQGLVERNSEKYPEAKATLTKARAGVKGDWMTVADSALAEVSDPAADIAKRAKQLEDAGNKAEAIAVLKRGLKTLPDRKGPLYLQKAKATIDAARAKGPIKADDPLVQAAQKDAAEAAKEGLPEGYYLVGRIEEKLGRLKEAETSYRAAIKAHNKNDAEGSRYKIALARILLEQAAKGTVRLAAPSPEAVALERAALRRGVSLEVVAVLSLLTLQAGDLPAEKPATSTEAEKLADEIIADPKATFDAKAHAYAIKGLHTKALQVYTDGLRKQGLLSAEYADALRDLIDGHPILRRPEGLSVPDPTKAEQFYASGLGFYNAHKYASAEKEFLAAVENDKADARYYYFLGLSRLAQGSRDAYEDFEQGARLERQNKPGRAAVSSALERVQGTMRARLNEARSRPIREGEK
jgi:hypothetical protein